MNAARKPLHLTYLNAPDVLALALSDDEILEAVEDGLRAQGLGQTVIEPRMHLVPGRAMDGAEIRGHFNEIRVHSRRAESRNAFAERLSRDLGKPVIATGDWETCVRGADIVVEAARLEKPEPLLKTEWIKRGAFVVPTAR